VLASGCLEEIPEEEQNGETGDGGEGEGDEDGQNGNETETDGEAGNETDTENGDGGEEGEDEGKGDEQDETDGETEPASFEVTSLGAPETVEAGRSFDWSLTVRNDGGEDGVFETAVTRNRVGEEPEEHRSLSIEVPAGEGVSRSFSSSHDFLGEYVYTVEETGNGFGVRVVEQSLTVGETYINPDGVRLTVETTGVGPNVEPVQSYSYTTEDGTRVHRSGDDQKFAVINVSAMKPTREPKELPTADEFVMTVDGKKSYESTERRADDAYEGGRTRVSRRGVVMFEISDRFDRGDDYKIYWTRVYPEGTAEAVWSTPDDL